MKELASFGEYSPWGLVLVVLTYILLQSQFTLTYPRDDKKLAGFPLSRE